MGGIFIIHLYIFYAFLSGYTCSVCLKVFPMKKSLQDHMINSHSVTKQRNWQCDICPKNYRYRNGLQLHMLSHTGILKLIFFQKPF